MELQKPSFYKQTFFENNPDFTEIDTIEEFEPTVIEAFGNIDELRDDVWIMQCPKNIDLAQLEGAKLKLPGKTTVNNFEAIAVENSNVETHSFGYCNLKGRYALRSLPLRGSIKLRKSLKQNEAATVESDEGNVSPLRSFISPKQIKVRHPIFGADYKRRINIEIDIMEKLQHADKKSKIRIEKSKTRVKVEKGKKRNQGAINLSNKELDVPRKKFKKIKEVPLSQDDVSDDLKWLQNIVKTESY